jgi:hypothetical protein
VVGAWYRFEISLKIGNQSSVSCFSLFHWNTDMSNLHFFKDGAFEFLEGGFPYSAGVIATPGNRLVRARFAQGQGMSAGFETIARHLSSQGRPLTSLCAIELRSPRQFSFAGFHDFNVGYVKVLTDWGLVKDGLNPVARSNVCPVFQPPSAPEFHAFTYSVPDTDTVPDVNYLARRDYVVAGSGEWPEGQPFPEAIVSRNDLSPGGFAEKVRFVVQTMQSRCAGLKGDWSRLTATQVYTAHDFHALLESHLGEVGLTRNGLSWHFCRPPILGLEFEMDVRSVLSELVLPV